MSAHLDVKKACKLLIGGKFPRSESGRYLPAKSANGGHLDKFAHASRKDFRDAVGAARAATGGWNKAGAYNRGQILYRAAEMLHNRAGELVSKIARATNVRAAKARREVTLAIDRLVHFAGGTDKYPQVFNSVNPVASAHFNFTLPEPPGGMNILTGRRAELVPHIAAHMDVNAIVAGDGDAVLSAQLQAGVAVNLKRYANRASAGWFSAKVEAPYRMLDTVEFKTASHPIGI